MTVQVRVDYAAAEAWKRRALATGRAEKLARQAVKVALSAVKAKGALAPQLADKARTASEAALRAAKEAEQVWADTAAILHEEW